MESYEDSHTLLYVTLAVVLVAAAYWFVIRENPSSDMQVLPSAPELVEPVAAPTVGPLAPALTWPETPDVDWPEEQDASPMGTIN